MLAVFLEACSNQEKSLKTEEQALYLFSERKLPSNYSSSYPTLIPREILEQREQFCIPSLPCS